MQRVAKFCKYLPRHGWEPIVLTVRNGNYEVKDETLIRDVKHIQKVYSVPSWEPHALFYRLQKKRKTSSPSTDTPPAFSVASASSRLNYLGELIRLNLFIA